MVNDPTKFWQNSPMGKKAIARQQDPPYNMPELKAQDGQSVFAQIATYILQTHSSEFEKGYLDLDDVWAKSKDANIEAYRGQLFKAYPKPWCGRRAYLFKIELDNTNETTPAGIVQKRTISKLKAIQGKDSYFFQGRVCAFKNKDLDLPDDIPENPEAPDSKPEVEDNGGFKYMYCSVFVPTTILSKVTTAVSETLKNDPKADVYGFFLTPRIGKKKKDDGVGMWYSVNADDVFFL